VPGPRRLGPGRSGADPGGHCRVCTAYTLSRAAGPTRRLAAFSSRPRRAVRAQAPVIEPHLPRRDRAGAPPGRALAQLSN
jgi:hypothetical protein